MSSVMDDIDAGQKFELSPEAKQQIEDIAVASFNGLLLAVVENVVSQLHCNAATVTELNRRATMKVIEDINRSTSKQEK